MIQALVIGWLKGRFAQWMKKYWKPILCAAVVILIYLAGWMNGAESERREWKNKFDELKKEAQEIKDARAKLAEKIAKERETWRIENSKALENLKRRLANEIKNNRVYDDCHAGDEFLRIYEESSGRSRASANTR